MPADGRHVGSRHSPSTAMMTWPASTHRSWCPYPQPPPRRLPPPPGQRDAVYVPGLPSPAPLPAHSPGASRATPTGNKRSSNSTATPPAPPPHSPPAQRSFPEAELAPSSRLQVWRQRDARQQWGAGTRSICSLVLPRAFWPSIPLPALPSTWPQSTERASSGASLAPCRGCWGVCVCVLHAVSSHPRLPEHPHTRALC